jgi:uncharacterized protein DUF4382
MVRNLRTECWLSASLLLCGFALAGCGSSGSSSGATGTLSVRMVDAPMDDMAQVNVWVSKCEASGPDGWKTIMSSDPPQKVNLLDIAQSPMQLGSAQVTAGHYNQIRLIVTQAQLVKKDGTTADVTIPSGANTGIKLNVNADVPANTITGILLDFNAHVSFHETGNGVWVLNPVIPASLEVMSGTISGTVTNGTTPVAGASVDVFKAGTSFDANSWVNGSVSQADGTFKVWALLAGNYDVKVTYTDPATNAVLTTTFMNVQVSASQDMSLGSFVVGGP